MSPDEQRIIECLRKDPVLSRCTNQGLARLRPYLRERRFEAGETLYEAGQEAEHLWLLLEGEVRLHSPRGRSPSLRGGHFGAESVTGWATYALRATAVTRGTALLLPRESLSALRATHPALEGDFHASLVSLLGPELAMNPARQREVRPEEGTRWMHLLGWLLTLVVPVLILLRAPEPGSTGSSRIFLSIFTAVGLMWAFNLMDDHIPGLFALLATLMMGLMPEQLVLSGFSSRAFFQAMSILGLGVVLVGSGVGYRLLWLLLLRLPERRPWPGIGVLLTGLLLTPVMPASERVAMARAVTEDVGAALGFKPRREAMTELATAALSGVVLFGGVFPSSGIVNFIVMALLPGQTQLQFHWSAWLGATLVAATVLLAGHLLVCALLFRGAETPRPARELLRGQLALLGPPSRQEWVALAGFLTILLGASTAAFTRLTTAWLGMTVLYGLMLFGFLGTRAFRERLDWAALVYLGSVSGIFTLYKTLGEDKRLASTLAVLGEYMLSQFWLFVLFLAVLVVALRLVIPARATVALSAAVFMPLAESVGLNPWIVGFIILQSADMWMYPRQCTWFQQFRGAAAAESLLYDERRMLAYQRLMNLVRLAAIYASLPYWKALKLL